MNCREGSFIIQNGALIVDISYNSESRVQLLKKRAKRCVCKYCGGQLNLKKIVYSDVEEARAELYCDRCNRIEFGIEPEIYSSAKSFVEKIEFDCYPEFDKNKKKEQLNIAKVSEIIAWSMQNMSLLNAEGFLGANCSSY